MGGWIMLSDRGLPMSFDILALFSGVLKGLKQGACAR